MIMNFDGFESSVETGLSYQWRLAGGLTELQHEFIIEHSRDDISEDFIFCTTAAFKKIISKRKKNENLEVLKLHMAGIMAQQVCYATSAGGPLYK